MKLIAVAIFVVALLFGVGIVLAAPAENPNSPTCALQAGSSNFNGTIAGQPNARWCVPLQTGHDTHTATANGWVDTFNHGLDHATCCPGYRQFEFGSGETTFWQHSQADSHWMVDVQGRNSGGGSIRPDKSFTFENGKLVVESVVAASIPGYGVAVWPEITISTRGTPSGNVVDPLYHYGQFGGSWTFGCRLEPAKTPVCALYDNSGRSVFNGGRRWEISFFQHVGGGNDYFNYNGTAWRSCGVDNPDTACRDRFRLELTANSFSLYVNNVLWMREEAAGLFPSAFVNAPLYVYMASWIQSNGQPQSQTSPSSISRFHWDDIIINPGSTGPAPTPTPVASPTPIPPTPTTTTYTCLVNGVQVWTQTTPRLCN